MENQIFALFTHDAEAVIVIQPDEQTFIREINKDFPHLTLKEIEYKKQGTIIDTQLVGQQMYWMIEPKGVMALAADKATIVGQLFTYTGKLTAPIKPEPGEGLYLLIQEISPAFLKLFGLQRLDPRSYN